MILGLGSDLCNIERIQASLDRFGERFEQRVFTEVERTKAARRPFTRAGTYAKRFAARSEEHTSELQSLMRTSYAVFCLKKKKKKILYNTYAASNIHNATINHTNTEIR